MNENSTHQPTVALVTGANKGIGREIAAQLAALGITVLLGARDPRRGKQTATALRADGGDVHPLVLDVTDQDTVDAAARYVEDRYGRLDILVNNAGIAGALPGQRPSEADAGTVQAVFDTNVFGVVRVTTALLPLLSRSKAPRIVNVSSSVGSLAAMSDPAGPFARLPAFLGYPSSKTALNALTVQYAKEFGKLNILVNAADPGACDTDLIKATGFRPPRTAADGAAIAVRLATLGPDGPSGGFFNDRGPVPW
jgi:NAD(P)-dependent dehydrogenase (short-subunit alcohol dehydrogenase family)